MSLSKSVPLLIVSLLWVAVMAATAHAGGIDLTDSVLEGISAQGISVGGDLSNSCTTGSNAICLGTFEFTDNHQFDTSDHKGAIQMSGYVQQNVSAEVNLNQTQSSAAIGVTIIGDNSLNNSTLALTNSNNATSFIGGF